jgi:thiol-disulfide isomerase/thioredoxin
MKSGVLATLAGIIFLALAFYYQTLTAGVGSNQIETRTNSTIKQLPEDVQLIGIDAKKIKLQDFHGKVLLVNFWATWCGPCMKEMPDLYSLQKRYESKGFKIIAINLDDDLKEAVQALEKKFGPAPFGVYQEPANKLQKAFAIPGVPYTAITNKNFEIVFAGAGAREWLDNRWKKLIEGLL